MIRSIRRGVLALLGAGLLLPAIHQDAAAIRVVTWNVFNYPTSSLAARQPHFRTIVDSLHADIIIAQELNSQAGSDSFLTNVLNVVEPGEWTGEWRTLINEGGSIFWKPAVVNVENITAISNTSGPRDFLVGRVRPVGYTSLDAAWLLYSVHLKAGSAASDSTTRRLECTQLRNNILNVVPPVASGGNFMVGGDYNMDNAFEGGYIRLTESGADNDGRCKDPLTSAFFWSTQWGNNSGFALGHTQSACNASCVNGVTGGGLDDRFDLWLTSYSMQDGEGLDYAPAAFADDAYPFQFGNDGQHYNLDADGGGFNNSVGTAVAAALRQTSDHMPVVIVIQTPAKIVADSQLDFGDAIVGGAPAVNLSVANGAAIPADELDYSFTPPAGFTAPGGSFQRNAGAAPALHSIGMGTGTSGIKSGMLAIATDDVDSLTKNVLLSGRVLEHSVGSLDSAATVTMIDVDLGEHESGEFPDTTVRVHNRQLAALQARLSVNTGVITGGDGRFSIVGGFTGALLDDVGKTYAIHFDDAGATGDSTYTATLTFEVSDEALPGATAGTNLVVNLSATPASANTDVLPGPVTVLRFYAPRPNPLTTGATFAFDLPEASPVDLAIYDLSGRRIATLADGDQVAGRHSYFWNARGAGVPAGIYFASFATRGLSKTVRVVVMP